jgi:hypothetical protein
MKGMFVSDNKGKPTGRVARNKRDPGVKSSTREKSPSAGAFGDEKRGEDTELHPAGIGGPEQNAGGPIIVVEILTRTAIHKELGRNSNAGAAIMILKGVRKGLKDARPKTQASRLLRGKPKCRGRLSKTLPFDREVPGDRGDCEKKSLTQGSE